MASALLLSRCGTSDGGPFSQCRGNKSIRKWKCGISGTGAPLILRHGLQEIQGQALHTPRPEDFKPSRYLPTWAGLSLPFRYGPGSTFALILKKM